MCLAQGPELAVELLRTLVTESITNHMVSVFSEELAFLKVQFFLCEAGITRIS